MIINSNLDSLLKPAPRVDFDWKQRLGGWLRIVTGKKYNRSVFEAQIEMVMAVVELEKEIHPLQAERKALKIEIPHLKSEGQINQVRANQMEVSKLEVYISDFHYMRDLILFIGDTMAIKILDVDAVKEFACYPSSGFISGKEGLRAELEAARKFYQEGYIVVLNDLTHCLNVGDLTLRKGDEVRTFEVKSTARAYFTPEAVRQIVIPIKVHNYIQTDVLKGQINLPDSKKIASGAVRVGSGIAEDWHDKVAGQLYSALKKKKTARIQIGKKLYLACRQNSLDNLKSEIEQITESGEWVVGNVRRRITDYPDIPPFSMWFKPETTVAVMSGDLIVLSAFSMSDLAELFAAKAIKITWKDQNKDLFPIRFESDQIQQEQEFEIEQTNIGDWHRLRVLYAFLAVESFVDIVSFLLSPEAMSQFKEKLAQKKNKN